MKKTLRPEKYEEVVKANGEFPGEYMSTPDGKLAVARVQFGNIVLPSTELLQAQEPMLSKLFTALTQLHHIHILLRICGHNMPLKPMC